MFFKNNKFKHIIILVLIFGCQQSESNEYLGQSPPAGRPIVFAPKIVSFGYHEHCLTISPDGDEIFYGSSSGDHNDYSILTIQKKNNSWGRPQIAPFSIADQPMTPRFSPDGKRLYFSSRKTVSSRNDSTANFDIYYIEKDGPKWSDPINVGSPINSSANEFAPAISSDGTLYFQYWNDQGSQSDIYCSRLVNGKYEPPMMLPSGINSDNYDGGPYISPEQDLLLFQSVRQENYEGQNTNIYMSSRKDNGQWGEPVNLGEIINSSGNPLHPVISPDRKYLFFSTNSPRKPFEYAGTSYEELLSQYQSHLNGYGTIFWVATSFNEQLKSAVK
jgi:Tol biopolymer transport system component